MKHKYILISGLAFYENKDMKKLSRLAKKGWILDGVSTFFYRLKKDKPQNLIYTIDYQPNYAEDYFKIFQDAGWTNITTLGKHIHIFSAMEGTKPIYSDLQEQAEQYDPIIKEMTRGSALFFVLTLLSIFLASKLSGWQSIFFMVLYCLTIFPFVFNFMPLVAYVFRRKKLLKN